MYEYLEPFKEMSLFFVSNKRITDILNPIIMLLERTKENDEDNNEYNEFNEDQETQEVDLLDLNDSGKTNITKNTKNNQKKFNFIKKKNTALNNNDTENESKQVENPFDIFSNNIEEANEKKPDILNILSNEGNSNSNDNKVSTAVDIFTNLNLTDNKPIFNNNTQNKSTSAINFDAIFENKEINNISNTEGEGVVLFSQSITSLNGDNKEINITSNQNFNYDKFYSQLDPEEYNAKKKSDNFGFVKDMLKTHKN